MNSDLKYDKINIGLRRGEVREFLSKGYNQRSIAEKLNVSDALIPLDIQWIREQSKEGLRTHLQEKLPYEFARAITQKNVKRRLFGELCIWKVGILQEEQYQPRQLHEGNSYPI